MKVPKMTTAHTAAISVLEALWQFISSVARAERTTAAPAKVNFQHISLGQQETYWIDAAPIAEVICVAGSVWVTADGDPREVVLAPGQVFTGRAGDRLGVHALEGANIIVR